MEKKVCRICGKFKNLEYFTKNNKMKDGYRNECKECYNKLYNDKEKSKKFRLEKEIRIEGNKICRICHIEKPLKDFHIKRGTPDGHRLECKECIKLVLKKYKDAPDFKEKQKEYDKKRYEEKRDQLLQYKAKHYQENREKLLIYKKEYRKTDSFKKIDKEWRGENKERLNALMNEYKKRNPHCVAWRSILYSTLKRLGTSKQNHTISLLGYSAIELKEHIEKLFTEGMSWKNYGEWQIDHIKPVISFLPTDDVKEVCDLENLRPLWKTTREINGVIYEGNLNRPKF